MGWYVHHVNIPAHDVRASVAFFHRAAGLEECAWAYPDPERRDEGVSDTRASLGNHNRGLHIVTERPLFAHQNGFLHNPTLGGHFAITVDDLDAVVRRLQAAGIPYDDAGVYAMADMRQVYCFDPSFNLVEINQAVGERAGPPPAPDEEHGRVDQPGGWYLHHVNIAVIDVRKAVDFYTDILGLTEKELVRPVEAGNFRADREALGVFGSDNRGLHLIRPDATWAANNGLAHNPSIGGHVALCVPDLDRVMANLDAMGVPYSDAGSIAMRDFRQVFCFDPSMNLIEFNSPC
ncbi:MAG: VOC family protein [Alphaproteobacteria bacterium]|nr:VOC family protein [Alphaproteobacteria bacterium]MCB9928304.1 VOC family protein [Alphaproteobacteria bacterium]